MWSAGPVIFKAAQGAFDSMKLERPLGCRVPAEADKKEHTIVYRDRSVLYAQGDSQ
jgi:hypothetical protein